MSLLADGISRQVGEIPVQLEYVTKTYTGSRSVTALRDISLTIPRGDFAAIVGPSGSGKTTLLSIMGTLERPTTGSVRVLGTDVALLRDRELSHLRSNVMGFVFQQFHLLPTLSALENVETGMLYQGLRGASRRHRAREALDLVGLSSRILHRPSELSGGEQQRVAIARAIAGKPAILFADEPTGALDQQTGRAIIDCLAEISAGGTAVVTVTHNQELAARFRRQLRIVDGQLGGSTP